MNKPKTIVLYKGISQYHAQDIFIDQLSNALNNLGNKSFIINLSSDHPQKTFNIFTANQCDLIFSFNGIFIDYLPTNLIHILNKIPFITSLVDHPIHHLLRIQPHVRDLLTIGCCDTSHVEFVSNNLSYHTKNIFFPLAGCQCNSKEENPPRPLDIVFLGSFIDPSTIETQWQRFPFYIRQLLYKITDNVVNNHPIAIETSALYVLQSMGYEDIKEINKLLSILIYESETYIRSLLRKTCIEVLDKAGISINVYGNNWQPVFKNVKIHPPVDFLQSLKIMQQAKIVLDISPMFPHGSHDRVFSAMLNGAVAITDFSTFYHQNFNLGEDLICYRWSNLEELPTIINELLSHPETLQSIALNGKETALSKHTWMHRAKQLLTLQIDKASTI